MLWTKDKIAALAPDSAILDRAGSLASTRKWRLLESDGRQIWGFCRSSGTLEYRAAIDLETAYAYCSCPAPKTPCKHILALLTLFVEQAGTFRHAPSPPQWFIEKRGRPTDISPDTARRRDEQRDRNRDQRLELMQEGAADLERWLLDLVRQGLADLAAQPDGYLDEMAARLVDAQLSGPARRIRHWKTLRLQEDWPERLLAELGELYLLAQALSRFDTLPQALKGEVLATAGVNTKKEDILRQPGIRGQWLVAGTVEGTDETLRYRRAWLIGAGTARIALLLDFAWGDRPFEENWISGSALDAELVFYPAAFPLRALLRRPEPSADPFETPPGFTGFDLFFKGYAKAVGANPWLLIFPALLEEVTPVLHQKQLLLIDRQGRQLPAVEKKAWPLLALSAGKPLRIFGEWNGLLFSPLSVFAKDRLVVL